MAKLSNLQAMTLEDIPSAPDWFGDFLQSQNAFNRDVFNQVNGGLSSANTVDKYATIDLDHGVATRVKIPTGMQNLVGIEAVRCIGVELGSNGQPTRKLYNTLGMPRIDWYPAASTDDFLFVRATFARAVTGAVGEYTSSSVLQASAIDLTSGSTSAVTSLPLSVGDWDCAGLVTFTTTSAPTGTRVIGTINTAVSLGQNYDDSSIPLMPINGVSDLTVAIPRFRINATTAQTANLVAFASFSAGNVKAYGTISARRAVDYYAVPAPRGRVTLRFLGG